MKIESLIGSYMDVNCYCLTNDFGECLLIEAGCPVEEIKKLIGKNKVCGILLTHAHFDHCIYVKDYMEQFNVPVFASEYALRAINDHNYNLAESWQLKEKLPIKELKGDGKIKIGHFDIDYYYCPGHSPCSICFLIGGNLFAGDVLFNSGIGRTDFFASSKDDMINSLEKLKNVEFEYMYSGHGEKSDYQRQKRIIAVFSRFLSKNR